MEVGGAMHWPASPSSSVEVAVGWRWQKVFMSAWFLPKVNKAWHIHPHAWPKGPAKKRVAEEPEDSFYPNVPNVNSYLWLLVCRQRLGRFVKDHRGTPREKDEIKTQIPCFQLPHLRRLHCSGMLPIWSSNDGKHTNCLFPSTAKANSANDIMVLWWANRINRMDGLQRDCNHNQLM